MRAVHLVPHTHWDREWYLSFEEFRERLLTTMDMVLELVGSDASYAHFHLDGQTAMIDDYLSLRPEREGVLRDLVGIGRLSCGPWVTLVDEFLVSGESIMRNLQDGLLRAASLGGASAVGYLPDQFGHIGQMPQLLASAGLDRAVVWRGVPAAVESSRFDWAAPDGSVVEALYLPFGYGQGARLPADAGEFIARLKLETDRLEPFLAPEEPALLMAGDDHQEPSTELPGLVAEATRRGHDVRICSLAEHFASVHHPPEQMVGELRSAARANLLPNTYSVRPHQKVERAQAETWLERYAEPLAALVPGHTWPSSDLDAAWSLMHLNGAHDSACGCSTDEVAAAVDWRTARATEIARAVADNALEHLASDIDSRGTLWFNPSPFERCGIPGLGWAVDAAVPAARPAMLRVADDRLEIDGCAATFSFEDQPDVGDLYTFCPGGAASPPDEVVAGSGEAQVRFGGCRLSVRAWRVADDPVVRVDVGVENERPDHRLRVLVGMREPASRARAGAPFEIVERSRTSEGGPSEPPSPCWPARGFVIAGGCAFLGPGVFEYELLNREIAVTLMRCTGVISRDRLETRKWAAGPAVETPGAQLIGSHRFSFGILDRDPQDGVIDAWERFALPLLSARSKGGGARANRGALLDLEASALSSVRRLGEALAVRLWNPFGRVSAARIGDRRLELSPYRIETVTLP